MCNALRKQHVIRKAHAKKMPLAVISTILGFTWAIVLGIFGAWIGGHTGAFAGIGVGLTLWFAATAYVAGR